MTSPVILMCRPYPIICCAATNSRHANPRKASGPHNPPPICRVCCRVCFCTPPFAISGGSVLKVLSVLIAIGALAMLYGCRDASPETQRVSTPSPGHDTHRTEYDRAKPLPGPDETAGRGPTPFYDEPLVVDTPPEAKAFVDSYRRVGKPRIVVFVNRGLDGQILPVTDPGKYTTANDVYLRPGQYDEAKARQVDYEMMEVLLADWMSADNKVSIVSPTTVHRELTEQERRDLQTGKPNALSDVGKRLDADVLIQVQ